MLKIPQLPFLLCEVRAAILDFILISWLFFKTIVRNAFLTPKYPRVEVLLMIVARTRSIFALRPFQFICSFTPCICTQYAHKNLSKVSKAATKLNLLNYPPRIKLVWLYLYRNNTSTNANIAHSVMQIKGSHLGYYIDSMVNLLSEINS